MALTDKQIHDINLASLKFLKKHRPPLEMRNKLDIAVKIENQSVLIYSIRPYFKDETIKIESEIAKTTWVKTQKAWKIFWMRADLKWHGYEPDLWVNSIHDFFTVVDKDAYGCFFG